MIKKMDHAEYQRNLRNKTIPELEFIIRDAKEAAQANPDGPNVGYYLDEVSYCSMELRKRARKH